MPLGAVLIIIEAIGNLAKAMKLVLCTYDRHALSILAIFNEAIKNSTAIYDYEARSLESIAEWFAVKEQNHSPVIGLEAEGGELLGFASYGSFRAWPAYLYTVEHSIYVHQNHRGRGLGSRLLHELIAFAQEQSVHVLVGGIDASNQASIGLHVKFGFTHAGTIQQVGFKFGRWLDLAFYQLIIK